MLLDPVKILVLLSTTLTFQPADSLLPTKHVTLLRIGMEQRYHKKHVPSATTTARSTTTTQLQMAIPSAAYWATSHVFGGALAAPMVMKASKSWYRQIDLPSWTPPDAIFGPVWTCLYSCMGLAAAKIYNTKPVSQLAMGLWGIHCILNLLWAPVFFGKQRLRLGFWLIALQLASLAVVVPIFYQIQPSAALLLTPYALWLTFATLLNKAICKRNPTSNGYNDAMLQADLLKLQQDAADYAGV